MTDSNILARAKKGDAEAIAVILNGHLQSKGITVRAQVKNSCLQIMLEAAQPPNQQTAFTFMQKTIMTLRVTAVKKVRIYGKQTDDYFPDWNQEFDAPKEPTLKERAVEGDVEAIAILLNMALQQKEITARVSIKKNCLQLMLESVLIPDQTSTTTLIYRGLINLQVKSIHLVKIYGRQLGEYFPDWYQEFDLTVTHSNTEYAPNFNISVNQVSTDKIHANGFHSSIITNSTLSNGSNHIETNQINATEDEVVSAPVFDANILAESPQISDTNPIDEHDDSTIETVFDANILAESPQILETNHLDENTDYEPVETVFDPSILAESPQTLETNHLDEKDDSDSMETVFNLNLFRQSDHPLETPQINVNNDVTPSETIFNPKLLNQTEYSLDADKINVGSVQEKTTLSFAQKVRYLHENTQVSVLDCIEALRQTNGNTTQAIAYLNQKGLLVSYQPNLGLEEKLEKSILYIDQLTLSAQEQNSEYDTTGTKNNSDSSNSLTLNNKSIVRCPQCSSTRIDYKNKGLASVAKGVLTAIGLMDNLTDNHEHPVVKCMNCGHSWRLSKNNFN